MTKNKKNSYFKEEKLLLANKDLKQVDGSIFKEKDCKKLKKIFLPNNKIDNIVQGAFDECINLTELNLSHNQIKEVDSSTFSNNTKLNILYLFSNKIKSLDLSKLNKCKNFEKLYICNNEITEFNKSFINNTLIELDLSCNRIENLYIYSNEPIDQSVLSFTNLKELSLFNNKLKSNNFIIDFQFFPALNSLDISSNLLEFINRDTFKNCNKANELKRLLLNHNKIKLIDIDFKNLEELDLSNNLLKNDLDNLLNKLPALQKFYVYNNNFSMEYIKLLEHNSNIAEKKIQSLTKLTDIGLIRLLDIPNEEKNDFKYLKGLKWENIKFFSVITGKNGVGKTSILNYIQTRLFEHAQNSSENKTNFIDKNKILDKNIPLYLKVHDKIIMHNEKEFSDIFNKKKRIKRLQTNESYSIYNLFSIEKTIHFLIKDLDDVNDLLKRKNFKYLIKDAVINENGECTTIILESNQQECIDTNKLSPGLHLNLLILLWQYAFSKYRFEEKAILLLDEPDSHLHPTAVSELINELKKLAETNVQIIMTTHNPTTVCLLNKENVYNLVEVDDKLEMQQVEHISQALDLLSDDLVYVNQRLRVSTLR